MMIAISSVLNGKSELNDLIETKGLTIAPADALAEFAGRVCYASEARLGDAGNFIRDRLNEGHADVIEHGWISALVFGHIGFTPNRYLAVKRVPGGARISGNLRAWYDSTSGLREQTTSQNMQYLLDELQIAAPSVFGGGNVAVIRIGEKPKVESHSGRSHVQALGWCYAAPKEDAHNQATFLIRGVSRSLTHQLVRHRLASISQQSQRYVDQNKAGWDYIIPPSIQADPEAVYLYYDCMNTIQAAYNRLRDSKIRKEDARYVLPNAATTKLVVSMPFEGLRHFIWLRGLDKAAQWEIRAVAQEMLELLHEIAPGEWDREMETLTSTARLKDGIE